MKLDDAPVRRTTMPSARLTRRGRALTFTACAIAYSGLLGASWSTLDVWAPSDSPNAAPPATSVPTLCMARPEVPLRGVAYLDPSSPACQPIGAGHVTPPDAVPLTTPPRTS